MAFSPADRKRQQRARVAQGASSSDAIQKQLLRILRIKVKLWCLDTDQTPATVMELVDEVAACFPDEETYLVEKYLGTPSGNPEDEYL